MKNKITVIEEDGTKTLIPMGGYSPNYYDKNGERWISLAKHNSRTIYRFKWTENTRFIYPDIK